MNKLTVVWFVIMLMTITACSGAGAELQPMMNCHKFVSQATPFEPVSNGSDEHILTVYAAASLTNAFEEVGKGFEKANPGVSVRFNFGGSQILRFQIIQGAEADIFASADHANMDKLNADELLVTDSYQDFVTNQLVVILPKGNPAGVRTLADLATLHIKLVVADSSVPAGSYTRRVLENLSADPVYGTSYSVRVLANVVSNETDVRQVVTKVQLGEADAGIAYLSDAVATPGLITLPIPDKFNIIAQYPIATLSHAHEPFIAEEFITYLQSPAGQEIMTRWGFDPVDGTR